MPFIGTIWGLSACKKHTSVTLDQSKRTEADLIKDSVYYYYSLYSLWGDMLDVDLNNNHAFTDAYTSPDDVLIALKNLTPYYPGYGGGIDRFSYLESTDVSGLQASGEEEVGAGFGVFITIGAVSNSMAYPIVYFVEGGSPAADAGIKRSDIVLSIEGGDDLGIPVSCNLGNCQITDEPRYQSVLNILLSAMDGSTLRLKTQDALGTERDITLVSRSYEIDPIVASTVFSYPEKQIGYLALSSFEDISVQAPFRNHLNAVFQDFEQAAIGDLILDMRYNTGGYVDAAVYLANKIINPAGNGELMYTYKVNRYLLDHPETVDYIFDDVFFDRNNDLNINTLFVLVTDITASAAELLINVLKPYMHVVLIAENEGTFGKPVGFFKQEIMGQTALWAASFQLINSRGEGSYWDGIDANIKGVSDYIFKDFGDPEETMIQAAIQRARLGVAQRKSMMTTNTPVQFKMRVVNEVPFRNMRK